MLKKSLMSLFAFSAFSATTATATNPKVLIKTSMGDIGVTLYSDKAPVSVTNFLSYVRKGHYNNTIFHRVIDGFMIQGGGFDKDFNQKKTDAPIKNEASNGLKNKVGTLAMARTQEPHSATAQFFINVKDNDFLDYKGPSASEIGYAVFGEVSSGMDVVQKIKTVKTTNRLPHQNVPAEAVVILEIKEQ